MKATPDGGVTVVGNGSANRPYLIGVAGGNPLLNIDVVDTPTLDLTISGGGTTQDKRKIQGQATQSLTNLKDVRAGQPLTEGDVPVWRTDHWEFEQQSGAGGGGGVSPSGVWGTAPLDAATYGANSLIGREIYLDTNGQVRARPEQITGLIAQFPVTALPTVYPAGTSVMYVGAADGAPWPSATSCLVVTSKHTNHAAAQWCYLNNSTMTKAWARYGNSAGWGPWQQIAGVVPHYAAYKTVAQAMPTANTFYTATFENVETNEGGILSASGVFTVPIAGKYQVNFGSHIQGTTSTSSTVLGLLKNGVSAADFSNGAVGTNKSWTYSRAVKCAAGDTLAARCRASVANANMYGSSGTKYTFIDITWIGA